MPLALSYAMCYHEMGKEVSMMADNNRFPATKYEVLAMLYIQSQDLSQKSPEDIAEMYDQAYSAISRHYGEKLNESVQRGDWSL